jgi:transcriptional activator protein copR
MVQINDEAKDFRKEMKGGRKTEEDAQEFALTLHRKAFTRAKIGCKRSI